MLDQKNDPRIQPGKLPGATKKSEQVNLNIANNFATVKPLNIKNRDIKLRLREYLNAKGVEITHNGFICCPWHEEKHPSCKINDEYVHCFACNESGDIYKVAAAIIGVPCDKEHFREIVAEVERTLGIPEWQPPRRQGKSNLKLSRSSVYKSELLKDFAIALDSEDMGRAFFNASLLFALFLLPDGEPPQQKTKPTLKDRMSGYGLRGRHE